MELYTTSQTAIRGGTNGVKNRCLHNEKKSSNNTQVTVRNWMLKQVNWPSRSTIYLLS